MPGKGEYQVGYGLGSGKSHNPTQPEKKLQLVHDDDDDGFLPSRLKKLNLLDEVVSDEEEEDESDTSIYGVV